MAPPPLAADRSIDPADVARFSAIAETWWDPRGPFGPLHRLNPARLSHIRETALARFGRDAKARAPFQGLRLLDVGCGGGLLCEPMARLGFRVTGIDASDRNVAVAGAHAADLGLDIDYRATTAEALLATAETPFDVVLTMEVVEHVADPGVFLRDCAALTAPGGLMMVATLNRTLKSLALGKVAAEHILRWVPAGTHDWRKFVTPSAARGYLSGAGLTEVSLVGVTLDLASGAWRRSNDTDINYMITFERG